MHSIPLLLSSFAGETLLAAGNRGFAQPTYRGPNPDMVFHLVSWLAVVAGMVAIAFIAWGFSYWQKWREARVPNNPRALFRELCTAHGLGRADRELLHEIAEWHDMEDPGQLFIEPQRFQQAEMHQALDCASEAKELQTRLFALES